MHTHTHTHTQTNTHAHTRTTWQVVIPTFNRDTQLYGFVTLDAVWDDNGQVKVKISPEVSLDL